ncbi:MAG TPA: isoprenylcysteine carboxylmethyltransferase family protein [Thermoanaerobaculia bacterium]|jgi:methyltransferase|nr:isoprenylcysteine carboxylmethyltransferase family protein [Thermoanaerobaculia bacterium]
MEVAALDTRVLYTGLVALVAAGRLVELRVAGRNLRSLLARGGVEAAPGHYRWMVILHTLFLLSCPLEVWLLGRPFLPALGIPMLVLAVLATGLRYWVIRTLDGRWTTRIVVLPGVPPVTGGPYRLLRHPNYLAVITEMFALPLVHTAWITAAVFSALNAAVLRVRIRAEEEALSRMTDYGTAFAGRPRLVPGGR